MDMDRVGERDVLMVKRCGIGFGSSHGCCLRGMESVRVGERAVGAFVAT